MVKKALFVFGLVIFLINIYGLAVSMRTKEIETRLSYSEVIKESKQREKETRADYLCRLNNLVHNGTIHYWNDEGIKEYNLTVPIWENYLLYAASYVKPEIYKKYEFVDYKKALDRGVGLCSQRAQILLGMLNEEGIDAQIVGLQGHVVVRAMDENNNGYILDPDYGVSMPLKIESISNQPELVASYYNNDELVKIYGGKYSIYSGSAGIYAYHPNTYKIFYIEEVSYILKWIIPLVLALPFSIELYKLYRVKGIMVQ